jgi:hypothetical protein
MLIGKVQPNSASCTHSVNFKVIVIKNAEETNRCPVVLFNNRKHSVLEETKDLSLNGQIET